MNVETEKIPREIKIKLTRGFTISKILHYYNKLTASLKF